MTATIVLVRHGAHDLLGKQLCGRMDGVGLNAAGRAQATRLGATLAAQAQAVLSSPLLRARETADPIAMAAGLVMETDAALNEIAMGDWTGSSFDQLRDDPAWQCWNSDRLHRRPPAGESMPEAQLRIAGWLQRVAKSQDGQCIVAVSHADIIKAAVCHALGLSVDYYGRFDIDPGSVTTLLVGDWGMKLTGLNHLPVEEG